LPSFLEVPDNKYVDTVVELARPYSLSCSIWAYFKLAAVAACRHAGHFLSRLNQQTTLLEVSKGRVPPLE